jgi:NAD(P)-dependent dehydrogenase (short-subunit alcohol dehydrogenase family)
MNAKQKVALVTGSSRGIGRGIALEMARQGYAVVVHGSNESPMLQSAHDEVKKLSPASICVVAELSNATAIRDMFGVIRSTFGRLDALVNNAATQNPSPMLELKESDWDRILAVNLKAPFLCAQQAAPLMQPAGGGKIVNISSVHATDPKRNFAHYSSSKAGLEMLSKCMALELAQYNVQANSIVVGAIGTEMTPPERQAIVIPAVPAARIGTVEEIARLVAFLCSNACDYMTGSSIAVDGGLTTLGFCASRPEL